MLNPGLKANLTQIYDSFVTKCVYDCSATRIFVPVSNFMTPGHVH